MNLEEFDKKFFGLTDDETVIMACDNPECPNGLEPHQRTKYSAHTNIKRNGKFLCRTCAITDEGRAKISVATSYERSEETRRKMSESKKRFYETAEGSENRKMLSRLTAKGHTENKYVNARRQGRYPSTKTGKWMFYGSSYELRFCWLLDQDETVETYETQLGYSVAGRGRCLDFLITYKDGRKKAVEVKPASRLGEEDNINQMADSRQNAQNNGWEFEICTEDYFGMNALQIRCWADTIREGIDGIDYTSIRKKEMCAKSSRHYHKNVANDKVVVWCDDCGENHEPLRLTYEKNIERNKGEYICEKKGGRISGSKLKPHLRKENPYAAEGKKKCNGECGQILPLEAFGIEKSKPDGRNSICKVCRAKKNKNKYHENKNKGDDHDASQS